MICQHLYEVMGVTKTRNVKRNGMKNDGTKKKPKKKTKKKNQTNQQHRDVCEVGLFIAAWRNEIEELF
jgi:hypothetical protein